MARPFRHKSFSTYSERLQVVEERTTRVLSRNARLIEEFAALEADFSGVSRGLGTPIDHDSQPSAAGGIHRPHRPEQVR